MRRARCCCDCTPVLNVPNYGNSVCRLPDRQLWLSTPYGDFEFEPFDSRPSGVASPWWGLYAVAMLPATIYKPFPAYAGSGVHVAGDGAGGCSGAHFRYLVLVQYFDCDSARLDIPAWRGAISLAPNACPSEGLLDLSGNMPRLLSVGPNDGSPGVQGAVVRPAGYVDSCDPLLIPLRFSANTTGGGAFAFNAAITA